MGAASQQVILIMDGMFTHRADAIQQSWQLSASNINLYVVGIGEYVDHVELQALAHDYTYVFSATDNDAFNTLLLETSAQGCIGTNLYIFILKCT